MHKIEISLTDEELRLLKKFYSEQKPGSDNNLATRNPIHIVQTEHDDGFIGDSYFLIYSEAKDYMLKNKYKLKNPYIFTRTTGNGNNDLDIFYKLLQRIGEKL